MSNKTPTPPVIPIYNAQSGEKRLIHRVDAWDYLNSGNWQLTPPGLAVSDESEEVEAAFEPPATPVPATRTRAKRLQQALTEETEG